MKKPVFIMMVGLPYSGKSEYAKKLSNMYLASIHSSDEIRAEILGDINDQSRNHDVFTEMHARTIADLRMGNSVVFDATNTNYKRRMDLLTRLSRVPCKKICVIMATPFDVCMDRMKDRERVVPREVVERMYKRIDIPGYYEGWDEVRLVYPNDFRVRSLERLFLGDGGLCYIPHDNPHHEKSIGNHCIATYWNISHASPELCEAALLHDIGKPFVKSFCNSKGEKTEIAHYYDHHHVSAYDSLFYTSPASDRIYIANLIRWHMRPYEIEKSSDPGKRYKKLKNLLGKKMFFDLMSLHKADIEAK